MKAETKQMRAYKFRVWNPVGGEMIPANENPSFIFSNAVFFQIAAPEPNPALEDYGQPVILQFTGLKLPTGREIYEGDVLHFHKEGSPRPASHLVVVWDNEKAAFGYRLAEMNTKGGFFPHDFFAEWHELEHDLLTHCTMAGHAFERQDWQDVFEYINTKIEDDE